MALAEQSPLDQALTRIIGEPGAAAAQQAAIELAPKEGVVAYMPGSFDWKSRIGTTAASRQTRPYTAPAAPALGGITMTPTAALGGAAAPAAAAPVGLTYEQYVAREQARTGQGLDPGTLGLGYRQYQANVAPLSATPYTKDQYVANQVQYGVPQGAMTPQVSDIGYNSYLANYSNRGGTIPAEIAAARTAPATAAAPVLTRPVNPGPRAPWQQSAQYWKDLEAYTKAGGK